MLITHKTYKGRITELLPNQYFVFGSNTQGRHGKGSALFAKDKCGAIYGQSIGYQGQSYAIITKDLTKPNHPSISKESIQYQIFILYQTASTNLDNEYLIAYSGTGSNLNGYSNDEMAWMFANPIDASGESFKGWIPQNIVFEEYFYQLIINALKSM